MVVSSGIGQYSGSGPTEMHMWAVSRLYKANGTRRLIVFMHSAGYEASELQLNAGWPAHLQALVENLNLPIMSFDGTTPDGAGHARHWGNDISKSRTDDAISYANSNLGAKTDKVIIIAASMGGPLAFNWALGNAAKVAGIALLYPAVNVQACHDATGGAANFASQIIATPAYGSEAAWTAAAPTHDPAQQIAGISALGVPMKMWYSTNDTIVGTPNQTAFAASVGSALQTASVGAAAHNDMTQVPVVDLSAFIAACA